MKPTDLTEPLTDDILLPDTDEEQQDEMYEHFSLTVDKGQALLRIDKFLTNRMEGASRNRIQTAADAGNILVNGKPVKSSYKVKPLDRISIVMPYPVREVEIIPENIPLDIPYEDEDIIIVNKPAGMVVHPGHGNYSGTLVNALTYHLKDLPLFQSGDMRAGLVHRIDKALNLPPISKIINIADIATKAEMAKAQFYRNREGKHIIPVPTIELKPHFSGYLVDPIQSFFKKSSTKRRRLGEKSIVRPVFSYYGRLIIDDSTILEIIKYIGKDKSLDFKPTHIHIDHIWEDGEDKGIKLSFQVVLKYGNHIPTLIRSIQKKIKEVVEYMTGMIVHDINIVVKGLRFS